MGYTYEQIFDVIGVGIYFAMGAMAFYGAYCVALVIRRIAQKRFSNDEAGEQFLAEVRERLRQKDFEGLANYCDTPQLWNKAVPQLTIVAVENRELPIPKLRRLLADKFERDVIADLEYRVAWIGSVVKTEPMLGLLGTVLGMIGAFAKIATMQKGGGDPTALAGDISFALWTTAVGLFVAIPLVLAGSAIHVRMGKLQDAVQFQLGRLIEELDLAVHQNKGD
ncbi:MAG: MotA/TolQ/ExbB proton channel family protein [Planctomycetaceae bacterium]